MGSATSSTTSVMKESLYLFVDSCLVYVENKKDSVEYLDRAEYISLGNSIFF